MQLYFNVWWGHQLEKVWEYDVALLHQLSRLRRVLVWGSLMAVATMQRVHYELLPVHMCHLCGLGSVWVGSARYACMVRFDCSLMTLVLLNHFITSQVLSAWEHVRSRITWCFASWHSTMRSEWCLHSDLNANTDMCYFRTEAPYVSYGAPQPWFWEI